MKSPPLLVLCVPALLAYIASEDAVIDALAKRQNAYAVFKACVAYRGGGQDADAAADVQTAVEKCKGAVKCPLTFTAKTLAALHELWCKKTPAMTRPVVDPGDTCDLVAWDAERSFVRELFGMQLVHADGTRTHPLVLELKPTGNSIAKCVRDALGNSSVARAPLILVCGFHASAPVVEYTYAFEFADIRYVLCGVSTANAALYENSETWNRGDITGLDACVMMYRRTAA